ncbi:MAG TPA: HEAT repeat domain-containing protein [Myxococcota bacterium]|nr:HEAT repeat domain-containing protein [Myxococcota bacterium]HRY93632.1 HEAT repeat domain-containing protein [Myxococcota bacterium]HSA24192.1 HEAT repeat domain-containing protein [Myxococcota bacterium]
MSDAAGMTDAELLAQLARRDGWSPSVTEVVFALAEVRRRRLAAAAPAALSWLRDSDICIVDSVCDTLVALEAHEAIPELLDLLRPEAEDERRINCVVDPFGWYEPPPREAAALALGALGAREAIPALLRQLGDEFAGPRAGAAEALGRLGAREARAAIEALLQDPDAHVRRKAEEALRALHTAVGP